MALIANLSIVLGANTTKAEKALNRSATIVGKLRKSVAQLASAYVGLRTAQEAVFNAANFERGFAKSIALLDNLTEKQRGALQATAEQIGLDPNVAQSANEAAAAFEFLFLAGQNVNQAIASLPKVAQFATAGSFDMARATDLLTDAQSALGLTSKNTSENLDNLVRVSDALVASSTIANASTEQFALALTNKAGAALRLLNKDVEEGLAVLAVFADQGLKGEAAGESLSIVFRDLQRAAIDNAAAFKDAQISVFDSNGTMRQAWEIVSDLSNALDGLSDKAKVETLQGLGLPFKSIANIQRLIGTSGQIKEYYDRIVAAGNVTERVANRVMPAFDKSIKQLVGSLTLLNRALILPTLTLFADALNGILGFLGTIPGKVVAWVAATLAISAILPKLISLVLGLANALRLFITGQITALVLQGPKGWAQLAASAAIAGAAIYGVESAFASVEMKIAAFTDEAEKAGDAASNIGAAVADLEGVMGDIDDLASNAFENSVSSIQSRVEQLTNAVKTPLEEFRDQLQEIRELASFLDPETIRRGVAKAVEDYTSKLDNSSPFSIVANTSASEKGTQEDFARQVGTKIEDTNEIQEDIRDIEREAATTLTDILNEVRRQPRILPLGL